MDMEKALKLVLETKKIILNEEAVNAITLKGAADYVTEVDTAVQVFLMEKLAELDPEVGFIAEEKENLDLDPQKRYWILDPIDGTTNLIFHYGMSAVSLGLYEQGEITMGIVYNPFTEEVFTAKKGQGAFLNGRRIHVSKRPLKDGIVSYGSCPYDKRGAGKMFKLYEQIFEHCADFRRSGSAALDLSDVACGRTTAYLEQNLKPWDYAAGSLILTEAGGMVTNWKGEPLSYLDHSEIFAASPSVEKELRKIIENWN